MTKRITVKAGARLSLQYHHHRTEIWTIVSGKGMATVGRENRTVTEGDTVSIRQQEEHRIHNDSSDVLVFLEVQLGDILDENDIVRIEDDFGRVLGLNNATAK